MSKDLFDNKLKNKIPDQAENFDAEAAWAKLEKRRKEKKRRPILWWIWIPGLLVLGAGAWFGGNYFFKTRQISVVHDNNEAQELVTNTSVSQHVEMQSPEQQAEVFDAEESGPTNKYQNQGVPMEVQLTDSKATTNYFATKTKSTRPSPVSNSKNRSPSGNFFPEAKNIENNGSAHTIRPLDGHDQQPGKGITIEERISDQNATTKQTTKTLDPIPVKPHPVLSQTNTSLSPSQIAQEDGDGEKRRRRKRKRKQSNWELGAFSEYGFASATRTGAVDLVDIRADEEQVLDLTRNGLLIRRQLVGPWYVESGLAFGQWTDKKEAIYKTTTETIDSNMLLEQIFFADSTVQEIYGEGIITTIHTREEVAYNRYQFLEIPVEFGGRWSLGESLRLGFSAGASFSLFGRQTGSITDGLGNSLLLKDAGYRSAGVLSGMGRVELAYVKNGWSIGVNAHARSTLNFMDTYGFDERRRAVGIGLAIRKSF